MDQKIKFKPTALPVGARRIDVFESLSDIDADLRTIVVNRVMLGIEWLDEKEPTWIDKFKDQIKYDLLTEDLATAAEQEDAFNIGSAANCVLGLTYGDYDRVVNGDADDDGPLLSHEAAVSFGFHCGYTEAATLNSRITWGLLQRTWSFLVEERLGVWHYAVPSDVEIEENGIKLMKA